MVFKYLFAKNLKNPQHSLVGYFVVKTLKKHNRLLEVKLAELSEIEPHFKVLEVGFGPGIGLKAAYEYIKDGPGQIYGIDLSERMVAVNRRALKKEIAAGKIHLSLGCVTNMPYADNTFDQIMHTNSYYYWEDMDNAVKELHRVIKPDGRMVCVLNLYKLREVLRQNLLQFGNIDPDRYMKALEKHGFTNIHMKEVYDKLVFQAIYATACK